MPVLVAFGDRQVWCAGPMVVIVYSREERRCAVRLAWMAIHKSITPEA
jgi:hypothetical protein